MPMKNSNDTIGNRNRDLPVCSAMPQPTGPPRSTITTHMEVTTTCFSPKGPSSVVTNGFLFYIFVITITTVETDLRLLWSYLSSIELLIPNGRFVACAITVFSKQLSCGLQTNGTLVVSQQTYPSPWSLQLTSIGIKTIKSAQATGANLKSLPEKGHSGGFRRVGF